ncbi:MAG: ABC transporter substrate-binding protein, partial [Streptomycetaceae bacterium]|nr:ABC transporter substrate-binding protein [Streptomycetaceae bacterium]
MTSPRTRRTFAVFAMASVLLATACSGRGDSRGTSGEDGETANANQPAAVSADFADLGQVCRPGKPSGASVQGVTDKE